MPHTMLHPRLRAAVGLVDMGADGHTARVQGAPVAADTRAALRHALANRLYEVFHAGLERDDGPRPRTLRDPGFEALLADAVPHSETRLRVPADSIVRNEDPEYLVVPVDGVRTLIPVASVDEETMPDGTRTVRYPAGRPALSAGFFLVDGSAGRPDDHEATTRFYLHVVNADAAPALWGGLLEHLEERGLRYRTKVSSSRLFYPRRDAIVVYLRTADAAGAGLVEATAGRPGVGRQTSVFAQELAPGLATACEPSDNRKGMASMSFGQHRAHAVADGLLDHSGAGHEGTLGEAVCHALNRAGVRPDAPWLNLPPTSHHDD
ncbi:T3SS effector HopA1 family protein [Streptomyces sp. NBC_00726]|uniref:T3SS effector HopA1 family protein n=1 Tax=Streptomyces sp. NBC_00726 TaxID=2903674 RepID=UPI00387092E8